MGLLIFTVVVSIVIWLMRRKIDREMAKDFAFERWRQSLENSAADPISDEDSYDENKRRLYEVSAAVSVVLNSSKFGLTLTLFRHYHLHAVQ